MAHVIVDLFMNNRGFTRYLVAMATIATTVSEAVEVKPRLRGVSHQYAFFVSIGCGVGLILAASEGRARLAASIYAVAVLSLIHI